MTAAAPPEQPARYCPVCHEAVAYRDYRGSRLWVHTASGQWHSRLPVPHDVNTYAPDGLLTIERRMSNDEIIAMLAEALCFWRDMTYEAHLAGKSWAAGEPWAAEEPPSIDVVVHHVGRLLPAEQAFALRKAINEGGQVKS